MNDRDFLAERFEQERPQLRRIAYRMLGTLDDADDAVQEAWIRLSRTEESSVQNLGAWLKTVVSRICLDMLRTRRSRREEFVGSWMPEPVVTIDGAPTPEDEALIADGVGLALYIVLETLTPAERLAFVLHDMFAVPFSEIAEVLERSPDAVRQLASRARSRSSDTRPTTVVSQPPRFSTAAVSARLSRNHASWTASSASSTEPSMRYAILRSRGRCSSNCSASQARSFMLRPPPACSRRPRTR